MKITDKTTKCKIPQNSRPTLNRPTVILQQNPKMSHLPAAGSDNRPTIKRLSSPRILQVKTIYV